MKRTSLTMAFTAILVQGKHWHGKKEKKKGAAQKQKTLKDTSCKSCGWKSKSFIFLYDMAF